ncbi:MAG: hypothetical protein KDC48_20320, partial [Planctomycetes bacterium]|nr:hypothetical protein [Planctomycetota bacterium]
YFPSLGRLSRMSLPGGPGVRLDSAMFRGLEVTPYYDSMLAKLIVHGEDRAQAIARCERAIRELRIVGVSTAMPVALRVLHNAEFRAGDYDTGILERIDRSLTPERRELAMLAAVAARFLVAERAGAKSADGDGDARQRVPVWSMLGRGERLWRNRS